MLRALASQAADVLVLTTSSGRIAEIEALGVRVRAFDFDRASNAPFRLLQVMRKLGAALRQERATIVHAIALKPIALAGLLFRLNRFGTGCRLVMHLTGAGPAAGDPKARVPLHYDLTLRLIQLLLRHPRTALMVENPDDATRVAGPGWAGHGRVGLLGGAGVDPDAFAPAARPRNQPVVIGFLGRMLWTKGVGDLVEAYRLLRADGIAAELRLGGTPDAANPHAIPQSVIDGWCQLPGVSCRGHVRDTAAFWREVDIAVVPSSWGEGMPRVLLEAAATALPLVVTDVPGCRHFVRDRVEGLIVPPGDVAPASPSPSASWWMRALS